MIVDKMPFMVADYEITGLWNLKNRKLYLFSATSSFGAEKLLKLHLEQPVKLQFDSEFELCNKDKLSFDLQIKPQ